MKPPPHLQHMMLAEKPGLSYIISHIYATEKGVNVAQPMYAIMLVAPLSVSTHGRRGGGGRAGGAGAEPGGKGGRGGSGEHTPK